jgi:crotonobetainyl-CoA:carnitine CoA-transferase CaiB-like acyl-CoA transferase
MQNTSRVQPLQGVKVLDFSTLLPGPMAGLMLAEAGALVLKIERPGSGEELRNYEPKWGRNSVGFSLLNRGKKSLAIDLRDKRQVALMEPLFREADVLIEQFRPGVMGRLGLGYDALAAINPRLVYCSITGYGQSGPKAGVAGHDLNYIGDAGLLALSMGPADRPTVPPVLAADLAGGSYPAVVNILLALIARERTGRGAHLDVAMTDNLFMLMTWALGQGVAAGRWPVPGSELLTGGSPRYQIYPTADGRHVAAAPLEQKFWEEFCRLIELPVEYRNDRKDPRASIEKVRNIIASHEAEHWRRLFYGRDCCCSIVASLEEALRDQSFHMRGLFEHALENEEGDRLPATPVAIAPQFRADPAEPRSAPALGAHNDEFLHPSPPQGERDG